ncbi:MAG TPA: enoyl-ACP reductase FabI [Mycobacteriales bacterium]|nr:enoyl-ACP reductase FabI [Mycobacteriales bacterium]
MALLDGKHLLVTGVLTEASIAFRTAELAQQQGAQVVLTGAGRSLSLTRRIASRLARPVPVVPLDVTVNDELTALATVVGEHVDRLDGVLHAIGYAPPTALGGGFLDAPWPDVATALHVSTYSLAALTRAALPLMRTGGSVVGLDFDASVAWPAYDWMGVAKAGLESTARYLARDLGPRGVRVNLVAAGPLRTMAARSIPGFVDYEVVWKARAPLGWDLDDATPVAQACIALLSDWFPATTGSVIHVDGGVHAVGA